ncbi:MAG: AAA family ATPase, partial [Planctomycetota bacterium]
PHSIVLLDEIEKAHPEVFNVLLQLMDEGRLTDGQGRTVDFRHTLLIMTSNLGSEHVDAPEQEMRDRMEETLKHAFRPEFINRIDETLIFRRLTQSELAEIVDIQFARLQTRLADRGIGIQLASGARDVLAERGYEPAFGARPLKRLIQKEIENPLARRILGGDFGEGDTIEVETHEGAFTFRKKEA